LFDSLTVVSLVIYLEYAVALPFNGGEIIYLNEIYCVPDMLATILYAGIFISLANTAGNAFTFAKYVVVAYKNIDPRVLEQHPIESQLDPTLIRTIAIFIVTTICFLHYTWSKLGLFLNKAFALYKILLLLVVFVAGAIASSPKVSEPPISSQSKVAALIAIFYAYEGWENATYVAGEIGAFRATVGRANSSATIRCGAVLAVCLVSVLYVLVAFSYYHACTYTQITDQNNDLGMAIHFAYGIWHSTRGLSIAIALSAVGNLIAVIYTNSKVKQAIAVQRILPFWQFFEKDAENPRGALVLSWIATTIFILACPTSADGYSFAIGIYEYSRVIFTLFVASGFLFLHKYKEKGWLPEFFLLRPMWIRLLFVIIFFGLNIVVIIGAPMLRQSGYDSINRFWWPCIFFIILAASTLYWLALWIPQMKRGESGKTWGDTLGFTVKAYHENDPQRPWPTWMNGPMAQARIDGTGRRVEYELSGTVLQVATLIRKVTKILEEYVW